MDAEIAKAINGLIAANVQTGARRTDIIGENLAQGLGVVQNTIVQSQGATSDDGTLIAALQAATGVPKQGSLGGS